MLHHKFDILATQIHEQWRGDESEFADKDAEKLIVDVDQFLELLGDDGRPTDVEYARILRQIDTAIAINNDPYARELRSRIIERYGTKNPHERG